MVDRVSFDGAVFSGMRTNTKMTQYLGLPGDIVVSKIRARQGSVGLLDVSTAPAGVTIHYRILTPDARRVSAMFLWHALRSSFGKSQFLAATGGAMKGEISEEALLRIKVPLPPLETQRAILAEWQKAQQAIAAAEKRARDIEEEMEARFFADLGLTKPTREEPPRVFAVLWSDFLRWSVGYNQTACTCMDITRGRYPVASLGSVLQLVQYGTSEKANSRQQGVPVLRINNIKEGSLDVSNLKHVVLPDGAMQGLLLCDGDILIFRTSGSRDLVGTCAVFHESERYVYASYLIRLRTNAAQANADFVACFINSALGRQQVNAISRQIMQNNINSHELRSLQIPLPPLSMQGRIMAKIAGSRARIAKEREKARSLATQIAADMEAYLVGTKHI